MKCMSNENRRKCENFGTHACTICQPLKRYCRPHGGTHYMDTKHSIVEIEKIDLKFLKHQIKACISSIAQDTSSVIAEIMRTSQNTISQLKQANKNVRDINELRLSSYDPKRISFLIEQVSYVNQKMTNTPNEQTENLINQKETLIGSLKDEKKKLLATLDQKEKCIATLETNLNILNTRIQELNESRMSRQTPNQSQRLTVQGTN